MATQMTPMQVLRAFFDKPPVTLDELKALKNGDRADKTDNFNWLVTEAAKALGVEVVTSK